MSCGRTELYSAASRTSSKEDKRLILSPYMYRPLCRTDRSSSLPIIFGNLTLQIAYLYDAPNRENEDKQKATIPAKNPDVKRRAKRMPCGFRFSAVTHATPYSTGCSFFHVNRNTIHSHPRQSPCRRLNARVGLRRFQLPRTDRPGP